MRRALVVFALFLALLAAGGLLGGGWYYSDELREGAFDVTHDPPQYDLEVLALADGRVTLGMTPDAKADGPWTRDGLWGIEWDGGYGQVGAIQELNGDRVIREFYPFLGQASVGQRVNLGSFGFPTDLQRLSNLLRQRVSYSSPLGAFPAWYTEGPRTTWVIFVHGKGDLELRDRRLMPLVTEMGFPSLTISYRNDEAVPADPDGFYRYGQTEWQDLEGAVQYALDHGADGVVLVGYSMGGSVVMSFLYRSSLADRVRGVILDAPMLDFSATVDYGASQRRLPGLGLPLPSPLTATAKAIAALRFDVEWGEVDYLRQVGRLKVPILLFHGDEDKTVPIADSDALARARPDLVTYVRVAGATHVRAWNVDPEAYEASVGTFLERVAP